MKPYEKISKEKDALKMAIIPLVEKFHEETGCPIDHITIDFVDVTQFGGKRETTVSSIRVVWS